MLAPQLEAEPEDPLLELGLAAREHYGPLADALRETTGSDIGLWREGIAWVAADEAEAGELRSKVAWQRQQGHLADWLDADEVKSPLALARADGTARSGPRTRAPWSRSGWSPRCGRTPGGSASVMEQDAATAIESRGDRVAGVVGRRGRYPAGDVVVAAGAWSGTIGGRAAAASRWRRCAGRWRRFPGPRAPGARSSTAAAAISSRGATRRSRARRWSTPASIPRSPRRGWRASSPRSPRSAPRSPAPRCAAPGPGSGR